jgi:iron complex transport system substrate-binding protein
MESPQRIVSLISSATEILFAIGVGDRVVAISHECDFPPECAGRPRVTHSLIESARPSDEIDDQVRQLSAAGQPLYQIDVERIAQFRPQLIVTQSQCDVCAVAYDQVVAMVAQDPRLRDTQILALNPTNLADVQADIARIGSATGAELAASDFIATLRKRIAAIASRTAALDESERPRTVCIEWIEPLMLAANWTPEIIEMAGGQNGLTKAGRHSSYGNWDAVISYDPEVILVVPCGFDLPRTLEESRVLQDREGWQRLSAVKSSRVFAIDGSAYFNRSGPRLVDSLEIAAHILHPRLFPTITSASILAMPTI